MSKLNHIKQKISEMEGGQFQRLCDEWLAKKGYRNIVPIGMMTSTNRVRKGTPDSLILEENGDYVLVEYTLQADRLFAKAKDDINKCLDHSKTGIDPENISQIIYCYAGYLSSSEISGLREVCRKSGVLFVPYGLDAISLSISHDYPVLAEDYLGVSLDTGQVISPEDFEARYNKNPVTTPVIADVEFRDKELEEALNAFESKKLLVVTGPPGVGKTSFCLTLLKLISSFETDSRLLCVFDKGTDLSRDLTASLSEPGNYILFIDDANRLDGRLDYLLHYLNEDDKSRTFKLILTVRDYASKQVEERAARFGDLEKIHLPKLTDDQIREFIEKKYGIRNPDYQRRIEEVADGNPRLAAMASSLAKKENSLGAISNVATLYDSYFSQDESVRGVLESDELMKVAAVVSILRTVDLSNEFHQDALLNIFGVEIEVFKGYITELHHKEMVNAYEGEIVKLSDQVLATYFIYQAVFIRKLIKFETLLDSLFPGKRKTLTDAISPVLNAFDHEFLIGNMKGPVKGLQSRYQENNDNESLMLLMSSFWFVIPTETLIYIRNLVTAMDADLEEGALSEIEASKASTPETHPLKVITSFKYYGEDELSLSLDIALELIEKSRESLEFFLREISETYSFKVVDPTLDYMVQTLLVEKVAQLAVVENKYVHSLVFIELASHYLSSEFRQHELSRDGGKVLITTIRLNNSDAVRRIRKRIFEVISILLEKETLKQRIIQFLNDYVSHLPMNGAEMAKADVSLIDEFIAQKLNNESLSDCLIMSELMERYDDMSIDYPQDWSNLFNHKNFEFSEVLFHERLERRNLNLDWQQYEQLLDSRIEKFFDVFSIEDFQRFMSACAEFYESLDGRKRDYELKTGIERCLMILCKIHSEKYLEMISIYLDHDNLLKLSGHIIKPLFEQYDPREILRVLDSKSINRKKFFTSLYYVMLPENYIDTAICEGMLTHYQCLTEPADLCRSLEHLNKYRKIDPSIFVKVVQILCDKASREKWFASPIASLFNKHIMELRDIVGYFQSNIELLNEAYIWAYRIDSHHDYDGATIDLLTSTGNGNNLLSGLVDAVYELDRWPSSHTSMPNLNFLWNRSSCYEEVSFYARCVFRKEGQKGHVSETILTQLFSSETNGNREEEFREKKIEFFKLSISEAINDKEYIIFLFSCLNSLPKEAAMEVIEFLFDQPHEVSFFESIPLTPRFRSSSGSFVPLIEKENEFLNAVMLIARKKKLLEHCLYLEQLIESNIKWIEHEKKRDFIET